MVPADEALMQRALALALRGEGYVEPNPMVGAVVIDAAGNLCGEGFHQHFGGPHAEVHALEMAGDRAHDGTLVVTLEPCRHFGKTPPCTQAIQRARLRRVVIATRDPNPLVNGGGIAELRAAGIAVTEGVRETEARALLAPFIKRVTTGRPWVIAKWAMTLDGQVATHQGDSRWVSSPESRSEVHRLRGRVDGILVGAGTVRRDDPLLTARPPGPRTAVRIVLTRSGELPNDCQLLRTARETPVLVLTTPVGLSSLSSWQAAGCEVMPLPDLTPNVILHELSRRTMTNLLLESGPQVMGTFAEAEAFDEIWTFIAPKLVGGAGLAPMQGAGVDLMQQATLWQAFEVTTCGGDAWLRTRRPPVCG